MAHIIFLLELARLQVIVNLVLGSMTEKDLVLSIEPGLLGFPVLLPLLGSGDPRQHVTQVVWLLSMATNTML